MSTLYVDNLQPNLGTGVSIPGHMVQVVQGTAGEVNINAGNYALINVSFTPKFVGSKFLVICTIPNITGTAGNYFQLYNYIGTSATPTDNTRVIYARTSMIGTGASNTQTLTASDYGSFTCSSTATHYVSASVTTEGSMTIARHSATCKLQLMEIAQ
jgi:predicted Abi (CAAX) family protease